MTFSRGLLLLVFLLGTSSAKAAELLAVLELSGDALPASQRMGLTNAVRQAATNALVGTSVRVMTQANMETFLTDMGMDASCISEGACEVDTLRNLQATYGITGDVVDFGGTFVVTLQLYETKGGTMMGSEQVDSASALELLKTSLPEATTSLVGRIPGAGSSAQAAVAEPATASQGGIPQRFVGLEKTGELESPTLGKLMCIGPGSFVMGSPPSEEGRYDNETQHRVELTEGFCVMEHEVTQGEWEAVMGENPSFSLPKVDYDRLTRKERRAHDPYKWWTPVCTEACPVEQVSWLDSVAFANAVSQREGLTPAYTITGESVTVVPGANGYRLLTEAQWEAAARGRSSAVYSGGLDIEAVRLHRDDQRLHPVCELALNAYGLCDMTGNVHEWVWDRYGPYPEGPSVDPAGPQSGASRQFRGGSWIGLGPFPRVAYRGDPAYRPASGNVTRKHYSRGLRLSRPARDHLLYVR